MVFDHAVKYNGKYYPPNTPIEDEPVEAVEKPVEKPAEKPKRGKVKKDA